MEPLNADFLFLGTMPFSNTVMSLFPMSTIFYANYVIFASGTFSDACPAGSAGLCSTVS